MIVAIYPRVSTQEQAMNGHSIDEQIERCKKFCEAMGWTVYNIYTDAGYSGADTNRPALQRMIKDIEAKKIDKVLVYKLDRLSRSQKDTLSLIEDVFLKNNTDFVSMSENLDTSTAFGRAIIGILAAFAQLERETIKERMAMGKSARAKLGKYSGSNCDPIGYNYDNDELTINEFEMIQVKEVFNLAEEGYGAHTIANIMLEKGYSHRFGAWNDRTVMRVLKSRYYIGEIKYNGDWYEGTHDGFIKKEQFDIVQKLVDERANQYKEHNRRIGKASTYLGGFLYCKQCGAKYAKNATKQKRKNGEIYDYNRFSCNSRTKRRKYMIKDPNCKNKHWKVDDLTDLVFGEIKKLSLDPDYIAKIKESEIEDERPAIIQKEIKKLDEQMNRFMDLYGTGTMPMNVLQERIAKLNDKKTSLEEDLENIEKINAEKLSHDEAIEVVQTFDEVIKRGNFEEIRAVLFSLIEKIEIDNDDITIHWTFL